MTTTNSITMTDTKKQAEFDRRVVELATITKFITDREQVTSADVQHMPGCARSTASRRLNLLRLAGAIHRIANHTGKFGGFAVYAPGAG
ncbi:hypothetical protein [Pseudoduganella aquatica]|uniref:hypothetical protein n=1 Tax=Pseudoduganella aquatica TaxID=2660641 RepID=UPI001E5D3F9C|nr:hypothetical protein [Pseudoduganella aquatica]